MRVFVSLTVAALLAGCGDEEPAAIDPFTEAECGVGREGWIRADRVTPDAVAPCGTGSQGACPKAGFSYVSGTGWCRP